MSVFLGGLVRVAGVLLLFYGSFFYSWLLLDISMYGKIFKVKALNLYDATYMIC